MASTKGCIQSILLMEPRCKRLLFLSDHFIILPNFQIFFFIIMIHSVTNGTSTNTQSALQSHSATTQTAKTSLFIIKIDKGPLLIL